MKHYRRYYPDELENVKDKYGIPIINSPFIKELIYRSKPVKQGGFLGNLFSGDGGAEYVSINVGYFKGTIRCYNAQRNLGTASGRPQPSWIKLSKTRRLQLQFITCTIGVTY